MSYIDETYGKQLEEALRGLVSRPALGQPWFGFHASEVPAGVLLFTATTHSRVLYVDFWKYIQDKNLVKTEEEWQTIYSEQGWCPFYSDGDGIDTFRMPILEESEKLIGVWAISAPQKPIPDATVEGIISELSVASNNALEAKNNISEAVTKAETAINGLNGVVRFVNDISADASGNVYTMPDYSAGVTRAWNTSYTAEVAGWIFAEADDSSNTEDGYIFIDGQKFRFIATTDTIHSTFFAPVSKGATYKGVGAVVQAMKFYPCKGV